MSKHPFVEEKRVRLHERVLATTSFGIALLAKLDSRARPKFLDRLIPRLLAEHGISMDELEEMMAKKAEEKEAA